MGKKPTWYQSTVEIKMSLRREIAEIIDGELEDEVLFKCIDLQEKMGPVRIDDTVGHAEYDVRRFEIYQKFADRIIAHVREHDRNFPMGK